MDEARLLRVLKALADPKRFRMLQEIAAAGELTCGQVGELFPLSQPTISHHLKILTAAGLLVVRESGQHHFISANLDLVHQAASFLPSRVTVTSTRKRRLAVDAKIAT
jgi:ArsR family transcriptional regulator, arsenate/arsenite/antimonite-responsive transcriptional repressor